MKKQNYISTVGRRRSSSSRVRLFKGKGESTVNGVSVSQYFPGVLNKTAYMAPLKISGIEEKYYFTAKVVGGGKRGQLKAMILSLAKAIVEIEPEKYRRPLKREGLLTRDSRIRQRRMVGTGGKARRQKQSPKR